MRDGGPAVARHRHLLTIAWGAAHRRLDLSLRAGRRAPHDRPIEALKLAVPAVGREQVRESLMGSVGLGDNEQAGGVLVEPVNDAGAANSADPGEAVAAVGDQRVHERSGFMAGGGMDDETGRLVDHNQMGVFIDYIEFDGLGAGACVHRSGNRHRHLRTGFDAVARLNYGLAVHPHMAFSNKALKARAADVIETLAQNAVEALTGFRFGYNDC